MRYLKRIRRVILVFVLKEGLIPTRTLEIEEISAGRSDYVYAKWEAARGDALAPSLCRDLTLEEFDWDIVPCLSILDVVDDGRDFRYRFWGSRNTTVKGYEMSGKNVSDTPTKTAYATGMSQLGQVIAARRPLAFVYEASYSTEDGAPQITFRFPLSSDGETIVSVLSYQDLDRGDDGWRRLFDAMWGGTRPVKEPTLLY